MVACKRADHLTTTTAHNPTCLSIEPIRSFISIYWGGPWWRLYLNLTFLLERPILSPTFFKCSKTGFKNLSSFLFKKMGHPRPLFRLFLSFQTNNTIIRTNKCEKVMTTSLRRRDSNTWPSEHESPPITTKPGLPPKRTRMSHYLNIQRGKI